MKYMCLLSSTDMLIKGFGLFRKNCCKRRSLMEESAWVDGASRFEAFLRIALPLAAPAFAV